ncbi:hypothetical protein BDQ12DRAFT_678216 [Crucibulum laeve]|uniref:Uncharacterized protein n=1 Tax=Crucibulum laeve TaxID=68775 RepID=A0A5C3M826_9AGAR|nr:hypothetical protein BDQ12DRAFT_678216 [Crucibulum laeve]
MAFKRPLDLDSNSPLRSRKRRHLSLPHTPLPNASSSLSSSSSTITFATPRTPHTSYPLRPFDSPTNPFGRKRTQTLIRTLPPPTSFSKHLALRFQLVRSGLSPKQGGVFRIVQVPLSYTFSHLRSLIAFLFGGVLSSDQDHLFEVKKDVMLYSALYKPGQIKQGKTWTKLSTVRDPCLYRPDSFNNALMGDDEDLHMEKQLEDALHEKEEDEEAAMEESEEWTWHDETEFSLGSAWPHGVETERAIVYHHSSHSQVHITINTIEIPRRRGTSNTPHIFRARGRVRLAPPPLPRPVFSIPAKLLSPPGGDPVKRRVSELGDPVEKPTPSSSASAKDQDLTDTDADGDTDIEEHPCLSDSQEQVEFSHVHPFRALFVDEDAHMDDGQGVEENEQVRLEEEVDLEGGEEEDVREEEEAAAAEEEEIIEEEAAEQGTVEVNSQEEEYEETPTEVDEEEQQGAYEETPTEVDEDEQKKEEVIDLEVSDGSDDEEEQNKEETLDSDDEHNHLDDGDEEEPLTLLEDEYAPEDQNAELSPKKWNVEGAFARFLVQWSSASIGVIRARLFGTEEEDELISSQQERQEERVEDQRKPAEEEDEDYDQLSPHRMSTPGLTLSSPAHLYASSSPAPSSPVHEVGASPEVRVVGASASSAGFFASSSTREASFLRLDCKKKPSPFVSTRVLEKAKALPFLASRRSLSALKTSSSNSASSSSSTPSSLCNRTSLPNPFFPDDDDQPFELVEYTFPSLTPAPPRTQRMRIARVSRRMERLKRGPYMCEKDEVPSDDESTEDLVGKGAQAEGAFKGGHLGRKHGDMKGMKHTNTRRDEEVDELFDEEEAVRKGWIPPPDLVLAPGEVWDPFGDEPEV